jgi:hypothetical protein
MSYLQRDSGTAQFYEEERISSKHKRPCKQASKQAEDKKSSPHPHYPIQRCLHSAQKASQAVSSAWVNPAQRISLRCPLAEVMRTSAMRFACSKSGLQGFLRPKRRTCITALMRTLALREQIKIAQHAICGWPRPCARARALNKIVANMYYFRYRATIYRFWSLGSLKRLMRQEMEELVF